jgi:hypothetical protein
MQWQSRALAAAAPTFVCFLYGEDLLAAGVPELLLVLGLDRDVQSGSFAPLPGSSTSP